MVTTLTPVSGSGDEPSGARPPLANTYKVEIYYKGPNNIQARNIAYVQVTEYSNNEVLLQGLAEALWNALAGGSSSWNTLFTSDWDLYQVVVVDNTGASDAYGLYGGTGTGFKSPPTVAPQVCICVTWPIAARYRGGHPRWYVPGAPTSDLAVEGGNMWSTTALGQFQADAALTLTAINAITFNAGTVTLGTISYYSGHVLREPPLWRSFTDPQINPRLCTQRRRLGKSPTVY